MDETADEAEDAPGPRSYPFIGVTIDLLRDPIAFFTEMSGRFGDVVNLGTIGLQPSFLVTHPDGVKHVLQEKARIYTKGDNFRAIKAFIGDGLAVSEGDHWMRQRRLMQPAFHRDRVAGMVVQMASITARKIEAWSGREDTGAPLELYSEMLQITQSITLRSLLGIEGDEDEETLKKAWKVVFDMITRWVMMPVQVPIRVPTPSNRRFVRALAVFDEFVYRKIEERRRDEAPRDDLLAMLMGARDEETGEPMSTRELRDEMITALVGGLETTATMLAWIFYLLSKHPTIARRVEDEVDAALGGRAPTAADLRAMPYARMVIDEALRLYPAGWAFTRTAVEDDRIGGFKIPAGALVWLSPWVTHRRSDFWENPEGFDPERFSPERSAGRHRFSYIPFSNGPRRCIGDAFGITEMLVVVAVIATRYRLHLVPGHPITLRAGFSLQARDGILATLHRRGPGSVKYRGRSVPPAT